MKLRKANLRIPIKKFARPTASSSVDDALTDEAAVNEMINVLRRRKELRKRIFSIRSVPKIETYFRFETSQQRHDHIYLIASFW